MKRPDCGDNSCRYAIKLTGMRTNGWCRCDVCPECGARIRPQYPQKHYGWCTNQDWIPEHFRLPDNWVRVKRDDRGIYEDVCPHGVGHPTLGTPRRESIHGCDGCCLKLWDDA